MLRVGSITLSTFPLTRVLDPLECVREAFEGFCCICRCASQVHMRVCEGLWAHLGHPESRSRLLLFEKIFPKSLTVLILTLPCILSWILFSIIKIIPQLTPKSQPFLSLILPYFLSLILPLKNTPKTPLKITPFLP